MTDKKPLDHAVELAVFAPIGFALEARRLLPSFVERGRAQVNMAKVVGQFAVTTGQAEAAKRVARVQEQAEALLTEFGLGGAPAGPGSEPAPEPAPAPQATPAPAAVAPVRSSQASASLPIADYDSLAASQVIPRLAGLSSEELDAVEAYEQAHRGRKTILGKVAQLREG
ncbi:MAG: hypothetical protein R2702_02210 [Acidimicrobiales bacterium]